VGGGAGRDQPDPWDGSYDLAEPQTFNRYAYVRDDPVNFVDPTGEIGFAVFAISAGIGAVVGGAGYAGGLAISNWLRGRSTFEGFDKRALGIAIGTGFVAGLAAPVVATSYVGAALLSTTANVAQYALTQRITRQPRTNAGYTIAAVSGVAGGLIGGPFTRATPVDVSQFSPFLRNVNVNRLIEGSNDLATMAANTSTTSLIRSTGASLASNFVPTIVGSGDHGGGRGFGGVVNPIMCGGNNGSLDSFRILDIIYGSRSGISGSINAGNLGAVTVSAGGGTICDVPGLLNCPRVILPRKN